MGGKKIEVLVYILQGHALSKSGYSLYDDKDTFGILSTWKYLKKFSSLRAQSSKFAPAALN